MHIYGVNEFFPYFRQCLLYSDCGCNFRGVIISLNMKQHDRYL